MHFQYSNHVQKFFRQLGWTLGIGALILIILHILSLAMTPPWSVQPLAEHFRVDSRDTSIRARNITTSSEGRYRVKTTHVQLRVSDNTPVNAILREPIGAPDNRPGCVFLHGSGTGKASEAYGDLGQALASAGISTIVQDKRLDNYHFNNRDYEKSAQDYEAGVQYLRSRDGVNPNKVGIYAESEGTWIATILLHNDPNIAFTIVTSAPVFSGRHMMAMAATEYLNIIGAPKEVQALIPKCISLDWAPFGFAYADFNALDYSNELTMPTLINYGTNDPAMPVEQGAQQLLNDSHAVGNNNVTLRYYPANHQMRVGSALAKPNLSLEPHYTHNLEDWINAVAAGAGANDWATPMIAGEQPYQEYAVPTHTKPGLITSVMALIVLFGLFIVLWMVTIICAISIWITNIVRKHKGQLVRRFTPYTLAIMAISMIVTPILLGSFLAYCGGIGWAALHLYDCSQQLMLGWNILHYATLACIILFCWAWVRVIHRCGFIQFDNDAPCHHSKIAAGHWVVIATASLCWIIALVLCTFFGLV